MEPSQANSPSASSPQFAQALLSKRSDTSMRQVVINQEQGAGVQEDIYRGEPPSPPRSRPPSSATSSSSSSFGLSGLGLHRGALGAILEMAINRWAWASSGSSTTTSPTSSVHTRIPRRRTRRSSMATSHNTHTESVIRARRTAWEQGRVLPREFVLFLPAVLAPKATDNELDRSPQDRRVFCSASLPLVLSQLEPAIKCSVKPRKHKQPKITPLEGALEQRNSDHIDSEPSYHTFQGEIPGSGKGKTRKDLRIHRPSAVAEKPPRRPAWWLDVSSPTWSDMREIGKLLHLHPLTLEDILHQEPREKLEIFPRLGYYFIVFRALDSELTQSTARTQLHMTMKCHNTAVPFTDGKIGATNVYIVVFREGICTFHFEDISDHTLRVRNKIIQFEETFHMSSDWIAHGILDAIVDQFFPLLNSIEREVKDFDDLVLSISGPLRNRDELREGKVSAKSITEPKQGEKKLDAVDVEVNEKTQMESSTYDGVPTWSFRCLTPFSWGNFGVRDLVPTSVVWKLKQWSNLLRRQEVTSSPSPLIRMASTRRLVTSLTRLLGTKSEVVSQIRKRLTGDRLIGPDLSPSEQAVAGEVSIYLGDIRDHILTLQQSLAHYERMLSHSHPAYLSHTRVSLAQAKAGMDNKLFMLSVLSVAILAMQCLTGVFSINVGNMPRNNRKAIPPAPFNYFLSLVAAVLLIGAGVAFLARFWWLQAERRFARARQSKF